MKTGVRQRSWLLVSLLLACASHAEDRVRLEGTSIIGNRELPKVLYIVPWHKPVPGDLERPTASLLDEALAPIDRDVFRRKIRYYEMSQHRAQAKQSSQP